MFTGPVNFLPHEQLKFSQAECKHKFTNHFELCCYIIKNTQAKEKWMLVSISGSLSAGIMKGRFFTHKSCLQQSIFANNSRTCSTGRRNYLCRGDESCDFCLGHTCCFHRFSPMTAKPKINRGPMRIHLEYRYIAPVFHFVPHLVLMLDMHPLNWLTLVKSTVRSGVQVTSKSYQFLHLFIPVLSKLPKISGSVFLDVLPKDTILLFKLQTAQTGKHFQVCCQNFVSMSVEIHPVPLAFQI